MVKAVWNDAVLAESDGTVIVEGIIISQTSRSNIWGQARRRRFALGKATRITIPLPPAAAKVPAQPSET
jgi:hypothetical protein